MELYPMHLLDGFGDERSDESRRVEHTDMETGDRELLDLRLGLSLGGVAGSSSARSIRAATEEVAPAPIRADVEAGRITAAPAKRSIPSFVFPTLMTSTGAGHLLAGGSSSVVMPSSSFPTTEANENTTMKEMPFLYTTGISNNRTIKGILYKYRRRDEVTIVCVCRGSFMTPTEFVRHTGGGDVINPLKHIFMHVR